MSEREITINTNKKSLLIPYSVVSSNLHLAVFTHTSFTSLYGIQLFPARGKVTDMLSPQDYLVRN